LHSLIYLLLTTTSSFWLKKRVVHVWHFRLFGTLAHKYKRTHKNPKIFFKNPNRFDQSIKTNKEARRSEAIFLTAQVPTSNGFCCICLPMILIGGRRKEENKQRKASRQCLHKLYLPHFVP
jgi:hypothetical protein